MLSKRQAEQEQTIKKLRASLRDVQTAADESTEREAVVRAELSDATSALECAQVQLTELRRLRDAHGAPTGGASSSAEDPAASLAAVDAAAEEAPDCGG